MSCEKEHCHEKIKALLEEKRIADAKNYELRKIVRRFKGLHDSGLRIILVGFLFAVGAQVGEFFLDFMSSMS